MINRLYQTAFWLATLFALIMAALPKPPRLPGDPSDKVQHIIAFTVLAILAVLAFRRTPLLAIAAGLSLFGAAIELIQLIPQLHRDGSWLDWLADTAAVGIVLGIAWICRRLAANRPAG